jgi:hypothetical protein
MATISKNNIGTGKTIEAEHITRIIDALNETGSADIIATGSFTGSFKGYSPELTVLDLTVNGTASINYFETIYETSSIIYQSGSTKFGNSADDTHQFTGSVFIDGDTEFNGSVTGSVFTGSFVGDGSGLTSNNISNTNLTQDADRELVGGAFAFDWYNDASAFLSLSDTYQGFGSNDNYIQQDSSGILLRSGNSRLIVTSSVVQVGGVSGLVGFSVVRPAGGGFGIDTSFFVSSSGKIITNDGPDYDDFNIKGDTGITGNLKVTGSIYVNNVTEGAGTDTVAMYDTGSNAFFYTSSAALVGGSDTNLANTNLSLTGTRFHDLNGFDLTIAGGNAGIYLDEATNTSQFGQGSNYIQVDNTGIILYHGLANRVSTIAGSTVINEAGGNVDLRVESDTNPNMLLVDAGLNRVGIGKSAPNSVLDVNGDTIVSGSLTVKGTAIPSTGETLQSWYVSDSDAVISLINATTINGTFVPTIKATQPAADNYTPLAYINEIGADTGTFPGLIFQVRSGSNAAVQNRDLFAFRNYTTDIVNIGTGLVDINNDTTITGSLTVSGSAHTIDGNNTFNDAIFLNPVTSITSGTLTPNNINRASITVNGTNSVTLADGTQGQLLVLFTSFAVSGTTTVTPSNAQGFSSIQFDAIGDTATLMFMGLDWYLLSSHNVTVT